MSSAIIPEIVGQTEILEESPMTEQEQLLLIEKETKIISAQAGKMERDLIIVSSSTFLCNSCGVIGDSSRISV